MPAQRLNGKMPEPATALTGVALTEVACRPPVGIFTYSPGGMGQERWIFPREHRSGTIKSTRLGMGLLPQTTNGIRMNGALVIALIPGGV